MSNQSETDGPQHDSTPPAQGPGHAPADELTKAAAAVPAAVVASPAEVEPHANTTDTATAVPATVEEASDEAGDVTDEAPAGDDADADSDMETEAEAEPTVENGFADLGLSEPLLRALHDKGYLRPTPIQEQAIPSVLMGRDVLGCAQTGTGKTAGFTLPLLDILSGSRARARMPRSLILEPTRELALQVAENFVAYGKYLKFNHALLIGGESMSEQKEVLSKGVDVLIATPGRLIDLFERGGLLLTDVKVLVIDEADRMLDMGFIPDIERIVNMLPRSRQTLFFSATMAPEIRRLADAFLSNPKEITVSKPASVATTITSGLVLVNEHDKREALRRLIRSEEVQNALIFSNRKRDVDVLLKSLLKHGFSAGALHGDLAQSVRFATLEKFKANELRLLVCSDVAARGIDIGGLSHVFNFDVPHHAEDYVHRIGRTGRAGREGRAFTIATPEDRMSVEAVEKLIGMPIPRIEVPGLDVVEWAEGEARKGRGRGMRNRPKAIPKAPVRAAVEDAKPSRVADEAPAPRERERDRDRPRDRDRDRSPRPPRPDFRRDEAPREAVREAPREERGRRDYRGRDDRGRGDNGGDGAAVRGFGPDVPAFMLIRKRGPLSAILDDVPGTDDEDLIVETNKDEDIAA